jgi:hypothetical protein
MATTKDAIEKRIQRLAQRMRRCAIHGTRLWCQHEVEWAGTELELYEGLSLYCRLMPYLPKKLPSTHQLCPTCGEPLVCEPCDQAKLRSMPPIWVPDDLCTPEEWARWHALKGHFRRTPGEHTGAFEALIQKLAPSWPDPPCAPEPIAVHAPLPAPPPTPQPTPTPAPEPEPVVYEVDDGEVDASTVDALQDLITQLTDQLKSRR